MWCIPAADAAFVAAMEEVLDLYEQPYDPEQPVVCFDESPKQLIAESRLSQPPRPGQARRYDYEYERRGTRNLFLFFEPLANQRRIQVTPTRTAHDFAQMMAGVVDCYPTATCIHVVLDNLNTHTAAALYATFPPAQARAILKRLRFHYTPKHASWLNMAEIEFSLFTRRLPHYIPDEESLCRHVETIQHDRNTRQATVNWQFTAEDARIRLKHLYPSYSN